MLNSYKFLQDALVKDFKGKDFVSINKMTKKYKSYKIFTYASFVIIGASLIPYLNNQKFPIAIIGFTSILFFENKSRNAKEFLQERKNFFQDDFKKYLNSPELNQFRELKLQNLKDENMTKREYISLVKEELHLIYSLIKDECESESCVDIIAYKNDVENIFKILNSALDFNLINKEDLRYIKKKWTSDIQVLCNQYSRTELEIDLKYLQGLDDSKK